MEKIKVNILPNPQFKKPGSKEVKEIQRNICKNENIKELDFKHFAYFVGEKGYSWKSSLLEGGAKSENFKEAYVLSLDFDHDIKIEEFLSESKDLGLEPTFIYETFSHKKVKYNENEAKKKRQEQKKVYKLIKGNGVYKVNNHRFRAIWRLNEVITMPQLKNAIQRMLMEVFPKCDKACKDLSRLWAGGKKVSFYNGFNTLNLDNLLNALVNSISENSTHTNSTRNIKAFCKNIGINIYNKYPFMLKSDVNHEKSYNIFNRELREKHQKIDTFIYDNMEFSFDTNSYDNKKASCKGAKIQTIKGDKLKKTKIDYDKLKDRCNLFNDFIEGKRLEHNEIFHLSLNLKEFEKYPTILKDTLISNGYNNYENKYNTYVSAINYPYAPSQCSKNCKYFNECMNPLNIKEKYYQKESKVKVLYQEPTITLEEAETELNEVPSIIKNMTTSDILVVKAVTGLGKTEMLKQIAKEPAIIGVPNHELASEVFERFKEVNPGILYVKPLNMENMPTELKHEIQRYYDLGIPGEVKTLAFEEIKRLNDLGKQGEKIPLYYSDLIEYVEQLEQIPKADTMLFTHHRISFGNQNGKIDTIILDEDFLESFIKYNSFSIDNVFNDLRMLRNWSEKFNHKNSKYYNDYLELFEFIEYFNIEVSKSINNGDWFENPLRPIALDPKFRKLMVQYIKENKNDLNMDIFKLFRAEYVSVKQGQFIHIANGEAIKELKDYKVVVMSATIDEEIHMAFIKKYLPNKNIIFKNIANTELKGEIICDCSYPWSRDGLRKVTDKANNKLEKILNSEEYTNVISFMDDELINVEKYNKKKIAHFGATEGIDKYKNQNLCIIGTPHKNSVLYEAYGVLLTGKSPVSDKWKVKRVQKYGFEFDLNTYENETDSIFTKIQLYFLYSELIQAVGRARALRFDVKVLVNSALPLPNSTLI